MRAAAFVDAGYLYSAGSKLLAGNVLPRSSVQLDLDAALEALRQAVHNSSPSASLLRIYWYDGVPRTGPTAKQQRLADSHDVKLRLGAIAYTGRQKGVDSLIVTDLIELARNHAIADALLLSGDEDIRVGVQIAQTYGVRVHLLGIQRAVDNQGNQSRLLKQESDTSEEWNRSDIDAILTTRIQPSSTETDRPVAERPPVVVEQLDRVAGDFIRTRSPAELVLLSSLGDRDAIPDELDRRLLRSAADALERYLDSSERVHLRREAKRLSIRGHATSDQDAPRSDATGETEADRIRRFVAETIVEPARRDGRATISIRAGDVARSMDLQHNIPNVVSALGSRKFSELARVAMTDQTGPSQGPNTEFTFAISRDTTRSGS